jgi:hypothetical protein
MQPIFYPPMTSVEPEEALRRSLRGREAGQTIHKRGVPHTLFENGPFQAKDLPHLGPVTCQELI